MTKKKTSINIDDQIWQEWLIFILKKHGTSRKVSETTEAALKEYMQNHKR